MSSFTDPLIVTAMPGAPAGLARVLPPGFQPQRWQVWTGFTYAVGSLKAPEALIEVHGSFVFDGASVPLPLRIFVPMAHPDYIQAAALHDYMLTKPRTYSRRYCDAVFYEALGVLGVPTVWRSVMFSAVRIGAIWWHIRRAIGGIKHAR